MFSIEMLPAREGDCLWVRYGDIRKPRQILIDGGRAATYKQLKQRFSKLSPNQREFELLIITHVDRDHIEGALNLLEDTTVPVKFKDIWFNGYDHLKDVKLETFGAVQGERLSEALLKRKLPWNKHWSKKAVCLSKNSLRQVMLDGGMRLTILSPDRDKLTKLLPRWDKECKKAGLIPGAKPKPSEPQGVESFGGIDIEQLAVSPFVPDPGEPNGSTIAVLAECQGKRLLLAGDAHVDRLFASLKAMKKTNTSRIVLDAFKIAHHGSEHNVSKELIQAIDCPRYLISTNGSYFKHPTPAAIARIVKFGGQSVTLFFNYRSKYSQVWDNPSWKQKYGYQVVYPPRAMTGTLKLLL